MFSRRRLALIGIVLLVAVVGVGGWLVSDASGPGDASGPRAAAFPPLATLPEPTTTTSTEPTTTVPAPVPDPGGSKLLVGAAHPVASPATIAEARIPRVGLYSSPGDPEPGLVLTNPTHEGLPLVFLLMERRGDWLQVQFARRPNQATAWIQAADVNLKQTPFHIRVSSAAHKLTVFSGSSVVFEAPAAVGTGGTPTPTGSFFVDGTVKLRNPNGPYGAYQLSVAAFSNVLKSFAGGVGQIAIHGTNAPGSVGSSASHGCVRLTNADVTRLAPMVPVGTPVEIS